MQLFNLSKLGSVLTASSLIIATCQARSATAMNVPDAECPQSATPAAYDPDCCTVTFTCQRTDGAATITAAGTPNNAIGQTMGCVNCNGCPENPPPPMNCTQTLNISYTEQYNESIASGISGSGPISGSLNVSIGHVDARQFSGTATCGSNTWPACYRANPAYQVSLSTTVGISASVVSAYQWQVAASGSCCSGTSTQSAGTRTSTATGSAYNGGAFCEFVGPKMACP